MASYQSSPSLAVSPYVSNIDPQVYATVGMQKQQQYNQGVQKVQLFIDSVAGIEAVRDIDKQYLQESITNLQTDVQRLAGEDFSKANVVNQASGLASRIAKDPVIQNTVVNTTKYKKAIQQAQEAKAKGVSSPSNEWLLTQQIEEWINNPDINASFNGSYVPYRDYKKKAVEALKALSPSSSIREDQIMIGENGQLTISGSGVSSGGIMKTELAGISQESITKALNTYLDEGDLQQISIDAQYKFRGYDNAQIKSMIAKKTATEVETVYEEINRLKDKKSTLTNGAEVTALGKQIKALEGAAEALVTRGEAQLSGIDGGNRADILGSIYADEFINNFASAFQSEKKTTEIKDDPIFKAQLARDEFLFKVTKWGEEKALEEKKLAQGGGEGTGSGVYGGVGGGLSIPFEDGKAPDVSISSVKDLVVSKTTKAEQKKSELLSNRKQDEEWYQQQLNLYNTNKNIDPVVKSYIQDIEGAKSEAMSMAAGIKRIEDEANKIFKPETLKVPKDSKPVTLQTTKGEVVFSPEELMIYAQKMNTLEKGMMLEPISQGFVAIKNIIKGERRGTQFEEDFMNNELTPKEKLLAEAESAASVGVDKLKEFKGVGGTSPYTNITKAPDRSFKISLSNYRANATAESIQKIKEKEDWIQEKIRTSFGVKEPKSYSLSSNDKALKDIQSRVSQLISQGEIDDVGLGPQVDMDALKKLNLDNSTQYALVNVPASSVSEGKYFITVQGKGEATQYIPLTIEQKYSLFGSQFESPSAGFDPIEKKIALTGNRSTNFAGTYDLSQALIAPNFSKKDFPGIQNFGVSGDFEEKDGRYSLIIYAYDPIEKEHRRLSVTPPSGLMDKGTALALLQSMNDEGIYELLYGKKPTPEKMAEITKINQKAN